MTVGGGQTPDALTDRSGVTAPPPVESATAAASLSGAPTANGVVAVVAAFGGNAAVDGPPAEGTDVEEDRGERLPVSFLQTVFALS